MNNNHHFRSLSSFKFFFFFGGGVRTIWPPWRWSRNVWAPNRDDDRASFLLAWFQRVTRVPRPGFLDRSMRIFFSRGDRSRPFGCFRCWVHARRRDASRETILMRLGNASYRDLDSVLFSDGGEGGGVVPAPVRIFLFLLGWRLESS